MDAAGQLRHRKKMRDEDEALMQPLIQPDDDNIPVDTHDDHDRKKQLIPHPGPFNLAAFLATVLMWARRMLYALRVAVGVCIPGVAPHELSLIQLESLQVLEDSAAVPYDAQSPEHQAQLRRLWVLSFPGLAPPESLKDAQWKEMGWQGEDPATDMRGSGLFGLQCLLYMADTHAATFSRLLHKTDGTRSEWEYPFAAAGLNVQFMLCEALGISSHRAKKAVAGPSGGAAPEVPANHPTGRLPQGRGFLGLLANDARAFEEVFVAAFEALDAEWLSQRASYMQFNAVLGAVRTRLSDALASRPADVSALRAALLGRGAA